MSQSLRPNSLSQVIVLSVLHDDLTLTEAATRFGISRRHVHHLLLSYKAGGLEALEPRNRRPKSYITRFEALQPNESWQSDFTHWRLKDGRDVEIINWLADRSCLLLYCSAYKAVTGTIVIDSFNEC